MHIRVVIIKAHNRNLSKLFKVLKSLKCNCWKEYPYLFKLGCVSFLFSALTKSLKLNSWLNLFLTLTDFYKNSILFKIWMIYFWWFHKICIQSIFYFNWLAVPNSSDRDCCFEVYKNSLGIINSCHIQISKFRSYFWVHNACNFSVSLRQCNRSHENSWILPAMIYHPGVHTCSRYSSSGNMFLVHTISCSLNGF